MKLAILISGQTSRCMYKYHNINYIYNLKQADIYIVLSDSTSVPWTGELENNHLIITKYNIYNYYSQYCKACYIKILNNTDFIYELHETCIPIKYKTRILNDKRLISHLNMFYLRYLTLEFVKTSKKKYTHYLYLREDNQFSFPIILPIYVLYANNSLLTDTYNRYSGISDKIFFGKCEIFDVLFGTNFTRYITDWMNIGIKNNDDFQTEYFYNKILKNNGINIKYINFFRNDIRIINNKIVTPNLYKKTIKKILIVEYKLIVIVIVIIAFLRFCVFR